MELLKVAAVLKARVIFLDQDRQMQLLRQLEMEAFV